MEIESFATLISPITARAAGRALDKTLESDLNRHFPPDGEVVRAISDACNTAIAAGWMCNREAGGIRYGRVIKPGPSTHEFSVDVVRMPAMVGPHHRHPNGEIDLILPITTDAKFDDHGKGWLVYGPESAHCPTVTSGDALVLYLLPHGAIDFTRA